MKRITAEEFKAEFAAMTEDAKAIRRALRSAARDAGALAKKARRLYDAANRTAREGGLYSERPGEFARPAFRGLDKKMDRLIGWGDVKDAVADAARWL